MNEGKDNVFDGLGEELSETLHAWANITINELKWQMLMKKVHIGSLYRSFTKKVEYGPDGMPKRVTIGFMYHGRFVDMGVGNGVKLENIKSNREIWRAASSAGRKKLNPRKPKKWYSPTIYHEYQRAAELLAKKFSIEIPARFENLLDKDIKIKI